MENVVVLVLLWTWAVASGADDKDYTNLWVVKIHGGEHIARDVARDLGYTFQGQAGQFEDRYLLLREDHPELSKGEASHLTRGLLEKPEVSWVQQQSIVKRSRRDIILEERGKHEKDSSEEEELDDEDEEKEEKKYAKLYGEIEKHCKGSSLADCMKIPSFILNLWTGQKDIKKLGSFGTRPLDSSYLSSVEGPTKSVGLKSKKISAYFGYFNDPSWRKQWYLQDYRTKKMPVMDLNVVPVYKMGITGKGVVIAVVDDGLQHGHPDLEDNFVEKLSFDECKNKAGSNPSSLGFSTESHGTKCAGVIAMVANNQKCGVGIAYGAKIAGIRTLCSNTKEYQEASALRHHLSEFDIYSNSWGPNDDGVHMERLGDLINEAFALGISEGRNKRGALYMFAAGNGKDKMDNCGADGFINHIATIAITSASQNGKPTYYGERCSAVYATTYSGGGLFEEQIVATDVNGGCSRHFSGTSAATPLASGIMALVLQANPKLTYRDVMHLIVYTTEVAPLANNKGIWKKNDRGLWVSLDFGFGLLNAENMVLKAQTWETVPDKNTCIVQWKPKSPKEFTDQEGVSIEIDTDACQHPRNSDAVYFLEQIEVNSTVSYGFRGAITMTLTSPKGTKAKLLEVRPNDPDPNGLDGWSIKSVHTWGEDPKGKWIIDVAADPTYGISGAVGNVKEFVLKLHGTKTAPAHYNTPREYAAFRLPDVDNQ